VTEETEAELTIEPAQEAVAEEIAHPRYAAWIARILLATLFFFGSEILLWIDPSARSVSDWALLVVGYIALATLILDLAVRYRIRDIYDAMLVTAIYGLLAGILLNPVTSFADVPATLVSRVMGGHTLLGMYMFGALMTITAGYNRRYRRRMIVFAGWLGFFWGIWVRWTPSQTNWLDHDVSLTTMYGAAGLVLAFAAGCLWLLSRKGRALTPSNLQLSPAGFGVLAMVGVIYLMIRALDESVDSFGAFLAGLLIVLCAATLWYRRTEGGTMLLDRHFPPYPMSWLWILLTVAVFGWATAFAYNLRLVEVEGVTQLKLMELAFAGVGFIWLPIVALAFSSRAVDRQWGKMDNL
jgi:hypothetical protein